MESRRVDSRVGFQMQAILLGYQVGEGGHVRILRAHELEVFVRFLARADVVPGLARVKVAMLLDESEVLRHLLETAVNRLEERISPISVKEMGDLLASFPGMQVRAHLPPFCDGPRRKQHAHRRETFSDGPGAGPPLVAFPLLRGIDEDACGECRAEVETGRFVEIERFVRRHH